MIIIDGSFGEGGGQVLRTSLALSLVTGQAFKIINIRAKRSKPGLMRQHLTSVNAACTVGNAFVEGAYIGSTEITFRPNKIQPGDYIFSIETAGSATLVLQTILPALLIGKETSSLILEGGTHNPFAPPWDFLAKTFLPLINKMGPQVTTSLIRHGFYPAGCGEFHVQIQPCEKLSSLEIISPDEPISRCARALISNLQPQIAHRELKRIGEILNFTQDQLCVQKVIDSKGPGNVVLIEVSNSRITEIFTGFGERGVSAEMVAEKVAHEALEYLQSACPVGIHLADQLMLPLALAGKGMYLTMPLTMHSLTNMEVIQKFLDVKITKEEVEKSKWLVRVGD